MTYQETLDYLFSALPMFHRVGPAAYKPSLDNTLALAAAVGHPEKGLRCLHIAGTNGKGSCSHMLASVLQEAGYKTGLYTSPHLKDFRERMRVNGTMIPEEWLAQYVSDHRKVFDEIKPSFFEMSTVMAFSWFRHMRTDIAVIETGLGGRLDSTNIITPLLSVITNIGMDHMHLLGHTLAAIAEEKAGIIKPGVPAVIGEVLPETRGVFLRKSKETDSPLYFAAERFSAGVIRHELLEESMRLNILKDGETVFGDLTCDLTGQYQLKNILTVCQALEVLKAALNITESHIRRGLSSVKKNTGLQGRWQILSRKPLVICDTGHNEDGLREVMAMLDRLHFGRLHFVLGVVEDKDLENTLQLLPEKARYYFCRADIPRGLDAGLLQEKAARAGLEGVAFQGVRQALEAAKAEAGEEDLVFVGGSTFTVAEVV
ncbi:MAG: bifunctional folylpolyglutamate synthase/dihydrofolate synthase [Bacteroidia bacterium]|nr:bifunctional folylpolyglutamate synthase/dihydrofolate synthase [Bacteroidia bacterium]